MNLGPKTPLSPPAPRPPLARPPLARRLRAPGRADLDLTHPQIMGVLNTTPDSFSGPPPKPPKPPKPPEPPEPPEGSPEPPERPEPPKPPESASESRESAFSPSPDPALQPPSEQSPAAMSVCSGGEQVVAAGLQMAREGAMVLDIGPESTRPGAQRVDAAEQIRRIQGVVRPLRDRLDAHGYAGVWLSIDTTRAAVAEAALDAGACLINDVSAGREDPRMLALAAERRVPICLMHMQGEPGTMQDAPAYGDVVAEVHGFLIRRAAAAEEAGVPRAQILLDPGIGFGKTLDHNLRLIAALPALSGYGYPVLVGASRKRLFGQICPEVAQRPDQRLPGTIAVTVLAAASGVSCIRVHDVAANWQALRVARACLGVTPAH